MAKDTKFYNGKVCTVHPELAGLRYFKNRTCTLCAKARHDRWGAANPGKKIARAKAWNAVNKTRNLDLHLARTYGISLADYDALFKRQKGKCAICKRESNRRLDVDHNHKTKKVRGLLCRQCNHLLGLAKESARILQASLLYLERHK